ncbi:MAG: 5-formyltetrahydrofolate cyclo-ligase [Burkholderiales bacterium]|nr:5-formyltetrahydrofolate cyclo-ligase [Burkholderiales bacterium]
MSETTEIQFPPGLRERRAAWRKQMLQRRAALTDVERERADSAIGAAIMPLIDSIDGVLGFYWPIQNEYDARTQVTAWLEQPGRDRRAALPVVIKRNAPLEFRSWTPASAMQAAGFGTSIPAAGETQVPNCLLVPLVGFDAAGYRLGYGGGYYDRTIASLERRPTLIGVAYAGSELPSIEPMDHDCRMDWIVTERGSRRCA